MEINLLTDFIKVLFFIVLLILISFLFIKLNHKKILNKNNLIKVLETTYLDNKNCIYLIEINQQKFLVLKSGTNLVIQPLKDHA